VRWRPPGEWPRGSRSTPTGARRPGAGLAALGGACLAIALLAWAPDDSRAAARFTIDTEPVWQVADDRPIAQPEIRRWNQIRAYVDAQWLRPMDRLLAIHRTSPARDLNAWDAVPASSWFTPGRAGKPPWMAPARTIPAPGAQQEPPRPDHSGPLAVSEACLQGPASHLIVRDARGARYWIVFDEPEAPDRRTAAAVISSRLLDAAGYPVLPTVIDALAREELILDADARQVGEFGGRHALTPEALDRFFARLLSADPEAGRVQSTRLRIAAGRLPESTILGGFSPSGVRPDDPNDRIPHEDRRSLRGLRILACWLDLAGIRQDRTLDLYLYSERYVRHHLSGLGLTLGNHSRGQEDLPSRLLYPLDGFGTRGLDPITWSPAEPYLPFDEMQWGDALWGVRLLLAFTDAEIAAAVAAGRYGDRSLAAYIAGSLQERRDRIGQGWLAQVNSVDDFAVTAAPGGRWSLTAADLGVRHGLRQAEDVAYLLSMRLPATGETLGYQSRSADPLTFDLSPFTPAAWLHRQDPRRYAVAELRCWDHTGRALTGATRVHLYFDRDSGPRIVGIVRD